MIIRSFYSGHPKKRTDLNKVWAPSPLGHTLKKVILLISSGMESLRKRVEPSRHLPETGLPRSRGSRAKGRAATRAAAAAFGVEASGSELYDNLLCRGGELLPRSNAPLANQYESYESTANSESRRKEIWKHNLAFLLGEERWRKNHFLGGASEVIFALYEDS